MSITSNLIKQFGLPQEAKRYLRISDVKEDLVCLHYVDDAGQRWKRSNRGRFPFKAFRGMVIDTEENEVIARSFGETPTIVVKKDTEERKLHKNAFYSERFEGTIIRLSFYNEWLITTHRKIDTSNSRFATQKTFKEMFEETCEGLDFNIEDLDRDHCYVFIMVHPDNQITNPEEVEPALYHLDTLAASDKMLYGINDLESIYDQSECAVPKPNKLDHAEACHVLRNGGGVVTWGEPKINFISEDLSYGMELRGNEPNVFKRWCELREYGNERELKYIVNRDISEEIDTFEDRLADQFDIATGVVSNAINHVMRPDDERFIPLSDKGYPKSILDIAHNLLVEGKGFQPSNNKIKDELMKLLGSELYKTVVSDTNRFVKGEEFYNSKR